MRRKSRQSEMLSLLLRRLADVVDGLSDDELEDLVSGAKQPSNPRTTRQDSELSKKASKSLSLAQLEKVLFEVSSAMDRQMGHHILERYALTRKELTKLAQIGSVHVVKEDNIEAIEEKIIESTIGARLRSKAVRGD